MNDLDRRAEGVGFIAMREMELSCEDTNPSRLPRAGLSPDHDLDILVERRQQVHQTFDGEARQLVVTKRRDLRLRYPKHLGGIGLRDLARFKFLIQRKR